MNSSNYEPIKVEPVGGATPIEEPKRGQPKWLLRLQEVEREHGGTVVHMDFNDPELVEIRRLMHLKREQRVASLDKEHREEQDKMIVALLKANVAIDSIVDEMDVQRARVVRLRQGLGLGRNNVQRARFEAMHKRLLPYCKQMSDHSDWTFTFAGKLAGVSRETLYKHYHVALKRGEIVEDNHE